MKKSAGILVYRFAAKEIQMMLVHPGGPFYQKKDEGVWSIPKGEFEDTEQPFAAAQREFQEETGIAINGNFIELSPVKMKSGKLIYAWAIEKDIDCTSIQSNTFQLEWPPKSGKMKEFPEMDKADWFDIDSAKTKIHPSQLPLLNELLSKLNI